MAHVVTHEIERVVNAWRFFFDAGDWEEIVRGIVPKITENGHIYELSPLLDYSYVSGAIADMRSILVSEPHYHTLETEIYLVLSGSAVNVVGFEEKRVEKGDVVIMPPNRVHYTFPDEHCILAALNTPPFQLSDYKVIERDFTHADVYFDVLQFKRLYEVHVKNAD